jgi:hypothetical protein
MEVLDVVAVVRTVEEHASHGCDLEDVLPVLVEKPMKQLSFERKILAAP